MSERDDFSTTMRIDITAHIPETVEIQKNGRRPGQAVKVLSRTNRIGKAETQLIGSKDFQELLQNLYDGAIITRLDGQISSANIRALCFFNYSKVELCSKNITDVIIGADDALLRTIQDNLKNNQFTLIQAFCERKDESVFPAEISVNKLQLSGESVLSFFIRDITLRREAEEQLRTGFNAIQNSGNGIAIADMDANLVYLNAAVRQLWGLSEDEEFENRNIREFLAEPSDADDIIDTITRREAWRGELKMRRSNNSNLYVNASVAPNCNSDGDLTGMVISLLDISEQKAAREQLEKYARELGDRNRQMEEDLDMARDIQEALLPREYPVCMTADGRGVGFAHVYYPSGAVGGDFFDIFKISEQEVGVFLCDVMGHGMRAALVVATIRGLMEQLSDTASDPGVFLTRLNDAYNGIFEKMKDVTFATTFYCVVNIESGLVKYVDAGHPAPFIIGHEDGKAMPLDLSVQDAKGPAIGLFGGITYNSGEFNLKQKDRLILYTDGLSEEVNDENVYYENHRMTEFMNDNAANKPEDLLRGMAEDSLLFSGNSEFSDDVCILAVELL